MRKDNLVNELCWSNWIPDRILKIKVTQLIKDWHKDSKLKIIIWKYSRILRQTFIQYIYICMYFICSYTYKRIAQSCWEKIIEDQYHTDRYWTAGGPPAGPEAGRRNARETARLNPGSRQEQTAGAAGLRSGRVRCRSGSAGPCVPAGHRGALGPAPARSAFPTVLQLGHRTCRATAPASASPSARWRKWES